MNNRYETIFTSNLFTHTCEKKRFTLFFRFRLLWLTLLLQSHRIIIFTMFKKSLDDAKVRYSCQVGCQIDLTTDISFCIFILLCLFFLYVDVKSTQNLHVFSCWITSWSFGQNDYRTV